MLPLLSFYICYIDLGFRELSMERHLNNHGANVLQGAIGIGLSGLLYMIGNIIAGIVSNK